MCVAKEEEETTTMVDTAGQLRLKIWLWLEQKENCAKSLWKLVKELETLRRKCNAGECIGSSVSVLGAACLIGGAVATVFTAGAAAPFLGVLGGVYAGTGVAVSVSSKLIETFVSSSTMEEAEKVAKKSENIEEEIMELIKKLKMERVNFQQSESKYITEALFGVNGGLITGATVASLLILIETFLALTIKKAGQKITKNLVTTALQNLALVAGKSAAKGMAVSHFEYSCMHLKCF